MSGHDVGHLTPDRCKTVVCQCWYTIIGCETSQNKVNS